MADIRSISQRLRGPRDPMQVLVAEALDQIQSRLDVLATADSDLSNRIDAVESEVASVNLVIPAEGDNVAVINLDGTVDIDLFQGLNWTLTLTQNVVFNAPIRSDGTLFKEGDRLCIKIKQNATGFFTVGWDAVFLLGGLDVNPNPNISTVFNFTRTAGANWDLKGFLSGLS
jgi:hypothetical protein